MTSTVHTDGRRDNLRGWLMAIAAAAILAVISGLIASSGDVSDLEADLFHLINGLPNWLEAPMWLFQLAGLLFVPVIVAAAAMLFRRWWLAVALVVFVPLKLFVEHSVVKKLVERERPGTTICGYPENFDETCAEFRGDVPLDGLSFVSGHAIIAWGVATLLWPVLPGRWRWLPVAVAALNATARVYLGAHNPLDVIGGGAIGIALGGLLVIAFGLNRDRR